MALNTRQAIAVMDRGGAVFASDVAPATLPILDGMVVNSELCRCSHGEFTWYFAWEQKDSECEADKAAQMAKAIRGRAKP